ncbi:MAG: hypothetical protein M3539_02295 [Acidobacteriota bacterium]|nr:hypothetical protein [Acidobacteriota bacterium]
MGSQIFKVRHLLPAAFVVLSAAVFGVAQQPSGNKQNARPESTVVEPATRETGKNSTRYSYEFTQPQFYVRHILIEHDESGHGRISFIKQNEETPVVEPLELSVAATSRLEALWQALRFLDSEESYQSDREYPHLGTMRLKMEQGTRKRTAEFNWTTHKDALTLVNEYRRAADQAIWVFDVSVARESQPLNAPKLMDQMELMLKSNSLSDPKQLIPLLKELSVDEHIPLMARNHAARLLKKIDK